MATVRKLTIPMSEATRGLTLQVRITGVQAFAARAWLGAHLLRMAAWVIGLELEVNLGGGEKGPAPRPSLTVPPVRLSVADLERADRPVDRTHAARILVMLDGVEVREVVAYDCEEGWIDRVEHGRDGHAFVRDGQVAQERVHGIVTVRYREDA